MKNATEIKLTGHPVVDAIGQLHLEGNIIPHNWYHHIKYTNERGTYTDTLAVLLLGELIYWYRPSVVHDESTGKQIGWKKKFNKDMLKRSYAALSEKFGVTDKQIRSAAKLLKTLGLIEIELRTELVGEVRVGNVMYINLIPERIKEITLTLPTKSGTPLPQTSDTSCPFGGEGMLKSVRGLSHLGETSYIENTNKDYLRETTATAREHATLDAAAAARASKENEFEGIKDNQGQVVTDTPLTVNSQESVATEKDNQVDQNSDARAREQLSLSKKQEYLKLAGIRNNATLNKAMSTKSIDEVVMALGFLFEKEDEIKRNGKEPIHNRAAYFKKALEDGSALDWCQMMEYTKLGVELWKWATEARLNGIFARFDVGSNNAWIEDGFCTYKIDATKELCEQWGWDIFRVEIAKYDRKRRKESQQQPA